jgi:zinc transport system substrate-binding protein
MNWKQAVLVGGATLFLISIVAVGLVGDPGQVDDEGRLRVVATVYPLGYMAKEIGGDMVSVVTMVPPNQEVHVFNPSTSDMLAADRADVLLYNGAGLDLWFEEDLLPELDTGDKVVVETTKDLELLEVVGGHGVDDDGHDDGVHDPHTWISPHTALQQAAAVYEALVEADAPNEVAYRSNWQAFRERLEALDAEYEERLTNSTFDTIIVSHEAYGYLANRYGFEQHGVIGISANEQPSAATIADLVTLMEELGINSVFVDPVYSDDYALTLKDELEDRTGEDVAILNLYFMLGPVDGMDLLEQMEANLESLARGLAAEE